MIAACLFRPDGTIFARYVRPGKQLLVRNEHSDHEEVRSTVEDLTVTRSVQLSGQQVGT